MTILMNIIMNPHLPNSVELSVWLNPAKSISKFFFPLAVIIDSEDNQLVCLTSNSSLYSINTSSAAAVRVQNPPNDQSQYCSNTPLDPSFVCSTSNSSVFPGELTLFVLLEELAGKSMSIIDFNFTTSDGTVARQFSLNHGLSHCFDQEILYSAWPVVFIAMCMIVIWSDFRIMKSLQCNYV